VAIDDFGTGYSSLSHLSRLPIDVLKVDKSFVDRLGGASDDTSLVEAIIAMSAALNLVLVAEGIELVEQARWLHRNGSQQGQGFLWSRPVELERAQLLLGSGVRRLLEPVELALVPAAEAVDACG
jgi:sensor c-di-GMP phosphodiesterase-like protein